MKKNTPKFSEAYLRWKQQLIALKHNDLYTVKKLGREAREHFQYQKTGKVQLSLS